MHGIWEGWVKTLLENYLSTFSSWTIASSTSAPNLETPYFKVSNDPITGAIQVVHDRMTQGLESKLFQSVNKLSDNSKFHCQQSFYNYKEAGGGAYLMRLHTNPKVRVLILIVLKHNSFQEIIEYQWLKVSGPLRQSIYQKSTNVLQRLSIHNVEGIPTT